MCVCVRMRTRVLSGLSSVRLFVTLWTIACQAPLSIAFYRQGYWSGWPFPPPGDLPDSGVEPESPALQEDSLPIKPHWKPFSISEFLLFFCVSKIIMPQNLIGF